MTLENLPPTEQVRLSRTLHRLKTLGTHAYERFDGKERHTFDAHEEIGAYLESRSLFERSNIESLSDDLDRPLPNNLSAYVLVPVAAGQEVATLKKTLLQYAKQDADPSTWAIIQGYSPDYAWDPSLPFLTGHDPVRSLDTAQLANQPLAPETVRDILSKMEHLNLAKLDAPTSRRLREMGRRIIGLPA